MIRPVYAPKTGVGGEETTMRAGHYLKIMDNVETHIQAYTCSEREIGRREKRERGVEGGGGEEGRWRDTYSRSQ